MSTLSGIASKAEKGKSKYQCLDINNLYRGESLEPSQQKSTVPRCKYGMQSLGKVPSARRPPANLPSLKSENSGSEPAVSLVPTGGAGWGNKPGENPSPTTTQPNVTTSSNATQSNTTSLVQTASTSPSNAVLPTQSTAIPTGHDQTTSATTHPTTNDKSWSSVMAGEAGTHPPSFLAHQSPLFQQEFPKLSSGDGQNVQTGQKGGSDTQYGPGPSLRPQTEGSWIQGGGRPQAGTGTGGAQAGSLAQGPLPHHSSGVDSVGGRNNLGPHPPPGVTMGPGGPALGIPTNGPPMHGPPLHLPAGTSPQFRTMPAPFMYRGNFPAPPGAFPPNFQAGMGPPRQRFPGGHLSEGRFVGRPVDGEEIITRPIIKEEELNHMDDIARDSSWARPDEIDYNEKIVFSDTEESTQDEEVQNRRSEKKDRDKETKESKETPENDKERSRDTKEERDRSRDHFERDRERDRRTANEERLDKRCTDSGSRSWQTHNYSRLNLVQPRDRKSEDEILKEKRRLQIEMVAAAMERAKQRKEEEEKRHEETKRAAAKKLQQIDERLGKSQNNESKDREETTTTVVPLPNWADKNRRTDCDRDRSRTSSEGVDEKTRHEASEFRQTSQLERQSFLRSERDTRSRLPCDDRVKREYDEKDNSKLQSNYRQDRARPDERDRNSRSGDGLQGYTRHYQNNIPPRFLKQQAERNQSAVSSNTNYLRSSGSPQPLSQSSSNNSFDAHWSHSGNSFINQSSAVSNSGGRIPPRRFNSESSESNTEKSRNDREVEDWDTHDRFKSSRDRGYGKHVTSYYEVDHNRRFFERSDRRDLESERPGEENWDRERDSALREKDRERHAEELPKTEANFEEEREWRRCKERRSEERDSSENQEDKDRDGIKKEEKREDRRMERPQRPDSRDSRTSRESRNSRDSVRDDKHEVDHKQTGNGNRGFVLPIAEPLSKDEKKKPSDKKDDKDKKEQGNQRHVPGPPITREKLEASERNDIKRNLTQLKRFSDGKRPNEEKDVWSSQENKDRSSNELWSETATEQESQCIQITKQLPEEKNKISNIDKKEGGNVTPEPVKQDNQEKGVKNESKEPKDVKVEKQDEEKEKREKSGKNRGNRGRSESGRGRQGWSVSVFRSSHGNRGDRRRRDSGRTSGRSRFSNREWSQITDSDGSGEDGSASTESGKESKKLDGGRAIKPRSQFKKMEKEERNKETRKSEIGENKSSFQSSSGSRFDRKTDFLGGTREGFAPSGQPSRRGRGSVRMRGGISRRMDGYGPPSAKSPFTHHEDKKTSCSEKANEGVLNEKLNVEEEKGKQKQPIIHSNVSTTNSRTATSGNKGNQVPPRMQKKQENDQRESNRSKSSRGTRNNGIKQSVDQNDDAWVTTSENSEDERKHESRGGRKGYQRRAPYSRGESSSATGSGPRSSRSLPRSDSTSRKKFGSGSKNLATGVTERNNSGRSQNVTSSAIKNEGTPGKDEMKLSDGNLSHQSSNIEKSKTGGDEKSVELSRNSETDENRNKKKEIKDGSKPERKTGRDRDKERRSKSSKELGSQQQITTPATSAGGPQPLMSQVVPAPPSMTKNYERWSNLPPRLAKQRQNHRILKQQSSEGADVNKTNPSVNMFPLKEGSVGPPSVNAWEKPLRSTSPPKSTPMQMTTNLSEPLQSDNSSPRSSPHVPRDAIDKSLLDGSSPPVNTIIFENTNFKSTPNDIVMKNQFNNHLKQQRLEKGDRKINEEHEDVLGFSPAKTDLTGSAPEREMKTSEPPIIYGKSEDNSDMKLDFQFETELTQLTDDKGPKGMRDLARSIQQSTMSPSTADLNFKIASVKKVWESMHTVTEHSEDGNNVTTFSPNFSPDSTMDPSTYSKSVEGSVVVADDGSEVVYSTVPQMQVNVNYTASKTDVSSTTSNVCKVKPQQQTVLSSGHSPIGHSGQSPLSHGGPISPPPYSSAQAGQFNYQQTSIGGTAAQFGAMSAIPSPPTVLYNSSTQLAPAYQTFQIDGTQVLSSQAARSQFSQFPPYGLSQGIGQTSAFSQQSVYLHQTAPPTATPDLYQSSLSQYRIQPTPGPFGQSQLNNNPNTVLISSTANSLMSATVKPSTQAIGAIGTKGATPFQQNPLPSQHSQLFIPYDPVQLGVNQSYLPNSQIVQRGAPVQPSASSFYSSSAGAQAGFYQTPGSTLTQQGPGAPQLHQATGYSLQGFNSQSSATPVGLQSFGSQMGAQQFRTPGNVAPTTYLKSAVTPHHPTALNLAQKSSTTSNQQDVLDSVFSSASQIPSPKPRPSKQLNQQQSQQSPTQQTNSKFSAYQTTSQSSSQLQQSGTQRISQSNMNMPNVRSAGGSPRYPNPIQRPVSYQHNGRYRPQQPRQPSNVKSYFGSQDGSLKLEETNDLKSDDTAQMNCESKMSENSSQSKTESPEDDAPKD